VIADWRKEDVIARVDYGPGIVKGGDFVRNGREGQIIEVAGLHVPGH
jgi:hypothetical protein